MNFKENSDRSAEVDLLVSNEDVNSLATVYRLKFNSFFDWELFSDKLGLPSATSPKVHQRKPSAGSTNSFGTVFQAKRCDSHSSLLDVPQPMVLEYNRLIVYCQTVKLKELNINKTADLLGRVFHRCRNFFSSRFFFCLDRNILFREMISLNFVKAASFCSDLISMIL